MALPPIISNLPIFKTFKPAPSEKTAQTEPETVHSLSENVAGDVVEISQAAQQRLEGVKVLGDDDVPVVLVETQRILEENENISLGLDPDFS